MNLSDVELEKLSQVTTQVLTTQPTSQLAAHFTFLHSFKQMLKPLVETSQSSQDKEAVKKIKELIQQFQKAVTALVLLRSLAHS